MTGRPRRAERRRPRATANLFPLPSFPSRGTAPQGDRCYSPCPGESSELTRSYTHLPGLRVEQPRERLVLRVENLRPQPAVAGHENAEFPGVDHLALHQ